MLVSRHGEDLCFLTSFLTLFSSGLSSGSFGVATSSSLIFGVAFLVFSLADLVDESLADCGVAVPLVGFVVNLMVVFGFLADSERCGV
jgi:hypothetical protein